jgi:hypothetical protein
MEKKTDGMNHFDNEKTYEIFLTIFKMYEPFLTISPNIGIKTYLIQK